jgi:hypothetical protein
MLNKLLINWYQSTFSDIEIKKCLQYAGVFGTGYIGPDWKSNYWVRGRGEIVLKVYSPEDVLPVQLPADNDLQRAYGVSLREAVPINLARAMFPTMAGKIIPDRQSPSGLRRGLTRLKSYLSPVLNRFAADQRPNRTADTSFPVVDIYQTYLLDLSVNEGPDELVMGEPGTSWSYVVPVLGSNIPDGTNPDGTPRFRKASPEDAMIYPFRRLITWCNSGILRDDTSYWWHGMVPIVKMSFDEWAWEFLGYSMTRDLDSIEQSTNTIRRAIDDSANARLRPPMMFDDRTLSKSLVESVDTRVPGQAVGVDFTVGDRPMRPILEPQYYDVPPWILEVVKGNDESQKYLSGVQDFSALAKAQQIPSSDTVEKIMEMAGPIVTSISRNMEAALGQLGEMIKCMFFQFYTAKRRIQILGKDGITPLDTSYFTPDKLTPSHMPGEAKDRSSAFTDVARARMAMGSIYFKITPNSLHQITQMTRKLLYIQLQKAGIPIDPWTMAEINDIPNFGQPPDGTTTVFQRWVAFEKIKGELSASIQANAQLIMQQEQLRFAAMVQLAQQEQGPPPGQGGPGGQPPPGAGGAPGSPSGAPLPQSSPSPALGQNAPGRPPEFNGGSPQIVQKDGGTRSTITSK